MSTYNVVLGYKVAHDKYVAYLYDKSEVDAINYTLDQDRDNTDVQLSDRDIDNLYYHRFAAIDQATNLLMPETVVQIIADYESEFLKVMESRYCEDKIQAFPGCPSNAVLKKFLVESFVDKTEPYVIGLPVCTLRRRQEWQVEEEEKPAYTHISVQKVQVVGKRLSKVMNMLREYCPDFYTLVKNHQDCYHQDPDHDGESKDQSPGDDDYDESKDQDDDNMPVQPSLYLIGRD